MSATGNGTDATKYGTNEDNKIRTTRFQLLGSGAKYDGGGIRITLHGILYQINLVMLFLKRGLREHYTFSLASEIDAADKFDDLVFKYQKTDVGTKYRFLQAKSKQNNSMKIRKEDLLNLEGGDYSIHKYFVSYRSINNDGFVNCEYQDFIICTNIDIDASLVDYFNEIHCPDPFLDFDKEKVASPPKRLKLKKGTALYIQLEELLSQNPDHSIIVQKLGTMAATSTVIQIEQLFTKNKDWIMGRIFDSEIKKGNKHYFKLREIFLNPPDEYMKNLNEIFFKSYFNKYFERINNVKHLENLEDIIYTEKQKLSQIEFQLAKSFVIRQQNNVRVPLSKDEINTFLNKLVLAVNQPTEDEIKNIVQEEIGEHMNLIDSELAACKFQTCLLDWAKTRQGRFINNKDCEDFFVDVENQLASYRQTGLTFTRLAEIEKLGCFFKDNEVICDTKYFLEGNKDEQILVIYYDNSLLTEIKIMQLKQSSAIDEFIFCDAKVLVDQLDTQVCPLKAFKSRASHKVFIMFSTAIELNSEWKNILQRFIDTAEGMEKKRIILITPLTLQGTFETSDILKGKKYIQIHDINNTFASLCLESQEMLLKETKVIFQGSETIFGDLYEDKWQDLLSGDVLSKLIHRKLLIQLNNRCNQYDEVTNYYINRSIKRRILISRDIMSHHDHFQITFSTHIKDLKTYKDIILISDCKHDFDQLCQNKQNIHWLKNDNNELLWQMSKGSVSKLQNYVRRDDYRFHSIISRTNEDVVEDIADIKDKVVIIAAEPGMGKSTLLSHVAAQSIMHDNRKIDRLCIIRANLRDYCNEFYEWPDRPIATDETIQFVCKITQLNVLDCKVQSNIDGKINLRVEKKDANIESLLRTKLISVLYNNRKLVLLFDGFDEICPQYKNIGISLLQALQSIRIRKIWVTTRMCSIESDLENTLCTFSYKLVPFSANKQQSYLRRVWGTPKTKLDNLRFHVFFKQLARGFLSNTPWTMNGHEFMSVPQHIMMVGIIFHPHFKDFQQNPSTYLAGQKRIDLTKYDLYYKFVMMKFQKLYEEINFKDPRYTDEYDRKLKYIIEEHGKLALRELFSQNDVPQELVSDEEWEDLLQSVKSLKEKTGLVADIKGGRLFYVHQNFAEYFAANLLGEALLHKDTNERKYYAARDLLYRFLTGPLQPVNIMEFLNYKIVSTSEHASIFNLAIGNMNSPSHYHYIIDRFHAIFKYPHCKDSLGRTPLHLLYSTLDTETKFMVSQMLRTSKAMSWLHEVDDLFKWTPVHYAIACHACDYGIVKKSKSKKKYNIVNTKETKSKDMYGMTPYMIAARRGCSISCIQNYLADLPLNLDAVDDKGNTALHYALARNDVTGYMFATELIKNGADILIADSKGDTPLDVILKQKNGDYLKPIWYVFKDNTKFKKALLDRITTDSDLYVFMSDIGCF